MDIEERFKLITRNLEEVLTPGDLKKLLEKEVPLKHYIGFEISGKLHLGSAILSMMKVRDYQKAGVDTSVFLADWHTWINNKLEGKKENINKAAKYFEEVFKISLKTVGGDPEKLRILKGSELYHNNDKYWETVIDVAKHTTLSRMMRSITIAGRKEGESVNFALLIYPAMQVADIFTQGINLAHSGIDQRKAHVVAREVALSLETSPLIHEGEKYKPIALHHPLLPGLKLPPGKNPKEMTKEELSALKMSKSIPGSAIFVTDTREEVEKAVMNAYCPAKDTSYNPVLTWAKLLIFNEDKLLEVKRPEKYGGDKTYESYDQLEEDFVNGSLHPLDLKKAVAEYINDLLEPIREHFSKGRARELKEFMDSLTVTR